MRLGRYFSTRGKHFNQNRLVWEEFAKTTTCHGVKEILRSKKIFWKIFWTISVLVHVFLLVIGCAKVALDYFTVPTVTKVSIIHNSSLQLPRLAFCLPNSLDKKRMRNGAVPPGIIDNATKRGVKDLQFNANFIQWANTSLKDFVQQYSYSCDDILESGGFGSDNMNYNFCENSETIHHKHFGLCHVIAGGKQIVPGVQGGYRLNFKLPISFSMRSTTATNDMWSFKKGLAIELGNDYQHLTLNSLLISRDQLAVISLRSEHRKLVSDGRKCTETGNSNFTTGNSCFFWCRTKVHDERCGCGMYGVSDIYDRDLRLCSEQDAPCWTNSSEVISEEIMTCQKRCKPMCEEWEYKPTVTYINMDRRADDGDGESRMHGESHIRLMVGYNAMEYKEVREVQSFTVFMAISSLGGQAGLWMGCSILTLIHAFTYCIWALGLAFTNHIKTVVKRDSVHFFDENRQKCDEKAVNEIRV